jgi:hypothetical protein
MWRKSRDRSKIRTGLGAHASGGLEPLPSPEPRHGVVTVQLLAFLRLSAPHPGSSPAPRDTRQIRANIGERPVNTEANTDAEP